MLNKEIQLIERLLAAQSKQYPTMTQQLLYERGYLIGLLASLAYNDSLVRSDIIHRIKQSEK